MSSNNEIQDSFHSAIAATNNNLSRLSMTVTGTASSLVGSSYSGDLSRSGYTKIMADITKQPTFHKRLFTFSKKAPSEMVRDSFSSQQIRYSAVATIPDEMLKNLPERESEFSLFQGFRASTSKGTAALSQLKIRNGEPMTVGNMKSDYESIVKQLELLEIRKGLAASEIKEIDGRIAHLQSMRTIVFDRVANLEREEFDLESELRELETKLEEAGEDKDAEEIVEEEAISEQNGHIDAESRASQSDPPATNEGFPGDSADTNTNDLMSQSVYGRLQTEAPSKKVKSAAESTKIRRRMTSLRRKTMPTLQQYYEPGKSIRNIEVHKDSVTCFDFDIPFGTMVSASIDDMVLVTDLSRGEVIGNLKGHNASVKCVQMEDNLVVTGSADATAKLWDISDHDDEGGFKCVNTYTAHLGEVSALHMQGNTLVTGSEDKTIRQWDLQEGRCIQSLDVLWASTQSSANPFSDATKWRQSVIGTDLVQYQPPFVGALQSFDAALASGTDDGIVRLWDLRSGQVHRLLQGHTGAITALQFDEYHLITGSVDRSVRIWDLRTGSLYDAFAYNTPVTSLHFDSRRIVTTSMTNTVNIYDRETQKHWSCGNGETDPNSAIVNYAKCREGYLVESRQDGVVGVWAC